MSSLVGYYLWLKVVHLIAMIGWMVGILYLPRLFAYHADASAETDATFQQMGIQSYAASAYALYDCRFYFGHSLDYCNGKPGERVASHQNSTRAHARRIARHDVAPAQAVPTR